MPGDNSDKEGDPDQEYARNKYSYMYSMVEENEIEPFPKYTKRGKRMIANKFKNLHKRGFTEFDLLRFKKWTETLRLSSVLKKKNEDHKHWMFNLVMSDPTSEIFSTQKKYHQVAVEKSRLYTELVSQFFKSMK